MKYLMVLAALACLSTSANAMTGNELMEFINLDEKRGDVMGTGEAYILGAAEMATSAGLLCLAKGTTKGQAIAIVKKHFKNNPEEWHKEAIQLIYEALATVNTCPPKNSPIK